MPNWRAIVMSLSSLFIFGKAYALVGSTEGKFEVNNNGAATYNIPIQVPPGINGMEPKLALVYNSQRGNGLVGVGWSISGLSAISRCAGSIAEDGAKTGLRFSNHIFCLDGQRLIKIGADTAKGEWTYRTEIDNFSKVVAYRGNTGSENDPEYFYVWTKSGRKLAYGATPADNGIERDTRFRPQNIGTLSWMVNKVEDRNGNYMTVTYNVSTDNSKSYTPDEIQYTGNDTTGLAAVRTVKFDFDEVRTDTVKRFVDGAWQETDQLLHTITAKFGSGIVREYTLTYENENTGSGRSRLVSIEECGVGGTDCYTDRLSFQWRDSGTMEFAKSLASSADSSDLGKWQFLADVDGDGKADLFQGHAGWVAVKRGPNLGFYSGSRQLTTSSDPNKPLVAVETYEAGFNKWNELIDVNGDGALDIVSAQALTLDANGNNDGVRNDLVVWLGLGDGTFAYSGEIDDAITYGPEGLRFWNQLIDMNGDGLVDVFRVSKTNNQQFLVHLGKLDSASNYTLDGTCVDSACTDWQSGLAWFDAKYGFHQTNQLADMDGDGIIDVFTTLITHPNNDPAYSLNISILFGNSTNSTMAFSTRGKSPVSNVLTKITLFNAKYGGYFNFANQLVDVNGDGITDIVSVENTGMQEDEQPTLYEQNHMFFTDKTKVCTDESIPCNTYIILAKNATYSDNAVVHLGKGDGSFGPAHVSPGVFRKEGVEVRDSIQGQLFIEDRLHNTSNYNHCEVSQPEDDSHTYTKVDQYSSYTIEVQQWIYRYKCDPAERIVTDVKGITQWNQFADMDGDGFVDVVRIEPYTEEVKVGGKVSIKHAGKISIAYGDGRGYFTSASENIKDTSGSDIVVAVDLFEGFRARSALADIDGDGITDLFIMTGLFDGDPYFSNRHHPSLIDRITDGNGVITGVEYSALSATPNYVRTPIANSCNAAWFGCGVRFPVPTYPMRKFAGPLNVVTKNNVSDGDEETRHFHFGYEYKYYDARIDYTRGWTGFDTVTRIDVAKGLDQTTTFRQDYPFIGRPISVFTTVVDSGDFISITNSDWGECPGTVRSFVCKTRQEEVTYNKPYSITRSIVSIETTYSDSDNDRYAYDAYGNPETVSVTNDVDDHVVTTSYDNLYYKATETDYPGQLKTQTVTVTHATPSEGSRTKQIEREFYDSGQLQTETLSEPSDPSGSLSVTTTYTYEPGDYGLVSTKTVEGEDPYYDNDGSATNHPSKSRVTTYTYGGWNESEWEVDKTQAVGSANYAETNAYNSYYGAKSYNIDAAGTKTSWTYDELGRQKSEILYADTKTVTTTKVYEKCTDCTDGAKYYISETKSAGTISLSAANTQYDALGRKLRVVRKGTTDGDTYTDIYTDTKYDTAGRLWKQSDPYFSGESARWTIHTYDEAGRKDYVTAPNGMELRYKYIGLKTTVTRHTGDEADQVTSYTRDSQDQIIAIEDALGNTTHYQYGPFGVLKEITDAFKDVTTGANGNVTTMTYDIQGKKRSQGDPDMGLWQYRYNAFGELKWQKDAKGQITRYTYDDLGRPATRTESTDNVTTTWTYETTDTTDKGRLVSIIRGTTNATEEAYEYDVSTGQIRTLTTTIGQFDPETEAVDGVNYAVTNEYDSFGRPDTVTYPGNGLTLKYAYYDNNLLKSVANNATSTTYWEATSYTARDQVHGETWGNELDSTREYYAKTGYLKAITTGGGSKQNLGYEYYVSGNLHTRSKGGITETFYYDVLDRLHMADSNDSNTRSRIYDYDAIGNMTFKSGMGSYQYGDGAGPHAVTQASYGSAPIYSTTDADNTLQQALGNSTAGKDCDNNGRIDIVDVLCINAYIEEYKSNGIQPHTYAYHYDDNGNLDTFTSGTNTERSVAYTHFNKPATLTAAGKTTTFGYGPDYQRITKTVSGTPGTTTTYIGKLYEEVASGTDTEQRYYISVADRLVAIVAAQGTTTTTRYVHTDFLGSVDVITDASGNVVESTGFDDFGSPRPANWQDGTATPLATTTRGYTGHETDTESGLINMNARMYDPLLGRFMTADPTIPDVYNPQSLNRYSYVLNNPFRYVDPSGYFGELVFQDAYAYENGTTYFDFGNGDYLYMFDDGSAIAGSTSTWEADFLGNTGDAGGASFFSQYDYSGVGEDAPSSNATIHFVGVGAGGSDFVRMYGAYEKEQRLKYEIKSYDINISEGSILKFTSPQTDPRIESRIFVNVDSCCMSVSEPISRTLKPQKPSLGIGSVSFQYLLIEEQTYTFSPGPQCVSNCDEAFAGGESKAFAGKLRSIRDFLLKMDNVEEVQPLKP